MTRTLAVVGAAMGVLLTATVAGAQQRPDFGQRGEFIISADRLFSLFGFSRVSEDTLGALPLGDTSQTVRNTQTSLSILWGSTPPLTTFYTVPRVGFDYVIVPNVTLGGDLAIYTTFGGSTTTETDLNGGGSNTNSFKSPTNFVFGLAPRGGYVLGINDVFSIWLRGGFSFYTESSKTTTTDGNGNTLSTTTDSAHVFAIDLDPQLVISPIPHVGITAGLTADIPLAGGHSQEVDQNGGGSRSFSAGASFLYFGITGGLLVYF